MNNHKDKPFSVVISVYKGDNPEYFKLAIESLLQQTLIPNEIIITSDGPLTKELDNVLDLYRHISFIRFLKLEKNVGSGLAKNEAIKIASHNIIAIMDSDDISVLNRFEKQIDFIEPNSDMLIGGWIEEFNTIPGDIKKFRKTPLNYAEIISYGKWRSPINHVTIMFTKAGFEKVGGYRYMRRSEDWDLISRMLVNGVKVLNIPTVLVHVRAGDGLITRRRDIEQWKGELKLFSGIYNIGYINFFQFICNIFIRIILRILPKFFTKLIYNKFLRQ